jgi:hypothetical protein
MILMPIICHALKIDVLEMEQAFQIGYWEGEFFFTFHLEGAGGIPRVTHVFLELALDV